MPPAGMSAQSPPPHMDPRLLPFVNARDDAEARLQLDVLIDLAAPIVRKVVRSSSMPEDGFQETMQSMLKRLWDLRRNPDGNPIGDYSSYVSAVASRVCKGQIRDDHPVYWRLRNGLRHTLNGDPGLTLWDTGHQQLCGLSEWRDPQRQPFAIGDANTVLDGLQPAVDLAQLSNGDLVRLVFQHIGQPVTFDDLIRIVSVARATEETRLLPLMDGPEEPDTIPVADRRRLPDMDAEFRELLQALWPEIRQLPRGQKMAYLLNFTAADGELELFVVYGVSSIRAIGTELQITDEEFSLLWTELGSSPSRNTYDENFAFLWLYLPLSDEVIARMLRTTRQKVINLRKSAGDRLARRFRAGNKSCR